MGALAEASDSVIAGGKNLIRRSPIGVFLYETFGNTRTVYDGTPNISSIYDLPWYVRAGLISQNRVNSSESYEENDMSYEYEDDESTPPPVTMHWETNSTTGQLEEAYSDGRYNILNQTLINGTVYTMSGIDKFGHIMAVSPDGKYAYFNNQYNIGGERTATSTGERDQYGHLIGITNDTHEKVMLNDWKLKDGKHAWYERDNKYTGEIIVTDGVGEYSTGQYRDVHISSNLASPALPPQNNAPNPKDILELTLQNQQHSDNKNDYSDDTSFLYSKNVSKSLLENMLNKIGGKYGLPNAGTAGITVGGALSDALQGKNLDEIASSNGGALLLGKGGSKVGKVWGLNTQVTTILGASIVDTVNDKKDNEKERENVDFKKWGKN